MREHHLFFASVFALATVYPLANQHAVAADWQGSYSAQGSCYCIGQLPAHVSSSIIPTPVGGKTVAQVCKRLGGGPGLQKTNGLFNYPFYADAQCGHGPFVDAQADNDEACAGTLGGSTDSCQPVGPRWDLSAAFSSAQNAGNAQNDKPVVSSVLVDATQTTKGTDGKALKTTVIRSASTANREVAVTNNSVPAASDFSGKSVTIGGQRYLQARAGVPAVGGEPGSRIVLDDLVYLRDDASLDDKDLFKGPSLAAATPLEQTPVSKKKIAKSSSNTVTSPVVSEKKTSVVTTDDKEAIRNAAKKAVAAKKAADRAAKLKAEKEGQARLALELERKAREARLVAEASKEASDKRARALIADEKARLRAAEEQRLANEKIAREQAVATAQQQSERTQQSKQSAVTEASKAVEKSSEGRAGLLAESVTSALRLPPQVRASSRNFNYFEAMPASYDVGGTGLLLEGSGQRRARFHMLGRLGVSDAYQEVMVGGGYYLTPEGATRLTVVMLAGIEYGTFELQDNVRAPGVSIDFDDAGLHLGLATRVVLNNKFELKGGVGYSSFFGGDAMIFGGAYYHITPRLDATSRVEFGDNDLFGIGIRYYY